MKDGQIVERIDTGKRHGIACQLGGSDGRTLFLLTATGGHNDIGARVETTIVEVAAAGSP